MHRFTNPSSSADSIFPRVRQILMENQEIRQRINELEQLVKKQEPEHKTTVSKRANLEHEFIDYSNHRPAKQVEIEAKEMQHVEEIRQYKETIQRLNEKLKAAEEAQLEQLRSSENKKKEKQAVSNDFQEQIKNLKMQLQITKEDYERKLRELRCSRDDYVQNLKDAHEKEKKLLKEKATSAKVIPCCKIQGQGSTKAVGKLEPRSKQTLSTGNRPSIGFMPVSQGFGQPKEKYRRLNELRERNLLAPPHLRESDFIEAQSQSSELQCQGSAKATENELKPRSKQTLSTRNRSSIGLIPVTRGHGQQEDKYERLRELQERNVLARPHFQESYFIEAQSLASYGMVKGRIPIPEPSK